MKQQSPVEALAKKLYDRPGRPPGPPGSRRDLLLRVRLNREERDRIKRAARREAGGDVSEWVRKALLALAAKA